MRMKLVIALAALLSATAAHAGTIVVSTSKLDKFRALLVDAMKAAAQAKPGVTLIVESANGDRELQLEQMRKSAGQKIDAMIVISSDGDQGPRMTEIGKQAGVPLVFVNTSPANLADLPDSQVYVASDEKESGTLQAQEVCRQLHGKGKAVVLIGEPFHFAARTRTNDVDAVFAQPDCSGIQIVERQAAYWSRDYASQQMQEWLKAGVTFDAVIANNDEMALGAIQGLKQAGRAPKDIVIAGIDATNDALMAMQAGDLDMTVLQDANGQGKGAVEAAIKLAAGQKVPRETYIPFQLVTQQNLPQYLPKSQ
ncbi:substrate-binding domain-containing protein [Rhizobium rhizosphaerae]|nr:substrate-binding domain-containing protein [Xaviernesmea rhizosphaerae]